MARFEQSAGHPSRRLWTVPKTKATGIVRTEFGWRAYIRVGAQLYAKRFPPDATQTDMQDWRAATRVDALRRRARQNAGQAKPGTFAEDVETYLKTVRTMPSFRFRQQHLEDWIAVFGTRARTDITAPDIRTHLQQLRIDGKRLVKHAYDWRTRRRIVIEVSRAPLSASACNHRRTALMHFFTVMDGKSAANPVRDVPKFREPDPEPRGLPMPLVRALLDAMPDSATKARCLVLAWTGLPHASLVQIRETDVRWQDQAVYVQRRRKGKGTQARVVPLLPEAVKALTMMRKFDAWGPFSRHALRKSLHRACAAIGIPPIRPYDLRHSFGTAAYNASGDIRAVQVLLDHADAKLTTRYTLGAVDPRVRATLDQMRKDTSAVTTTRQGRRKRH